MNVPLSVLACLAAFSQCVGSHVERAAMDSAAPLTRLGFGSCNKQFKRQPLWRHIEERKPDAFAWLGDIVYADKGVFLKIRIPGNQSDVSAAYAMQMDHPAYRRFLSKVPVVGVWDDHDYGTNDGDRHVDEAMKIDSQRMLFDFLGVPADSPRRGQPGGGAWASYEWGPPGKRVHLILLDNRSHRDSYGEAGQDMLGEDQWAWLEQQLRDTRAEVTFIGSGIQVVSAGDPQVSENWARLPQSRARLLSLIAVHNVPGVLFLSGDVHFTEMHALSCPAVGYALRDLTSSGLTHATEGPVKRAIVGAALLDYTRVGPWHNGLNWGEVDIEWGEGDKASRQEGAGVVSEAGIEASGDSSHSAGVSGEGEGSGTVITLRSFGVRRAMPKDMWAATKDAALRALRRSTRAVFGLDTRLNWRRHGKGGRGKEATAPTAGGEDEEAERVAMLRWGGGDSDEGAVMWEPYTVLEHRIHLSALTRAVQGQGAEELLTARACLADSMQDGLTPACRAVLESCTPRVSGAQTIRYTLVHAVLWTVLAGLALLATLGPLWAFFGPYPAWYVHEVLGVKMGDAKIACAGCKRTQPRQSRVSPEGARQVDPPVHAQWRSFLPCLYMGRACLWVWVWPPVLSRFGTTVSLGFILAALWGYAQSLG